MSLFPDPVAVQAEGPEGVVRTRVLERDLHMSVQVGILHVSMRFQVNESWTLENCTVARCEGNNRVVLLAQKPVANITCANGQLPVTVSDPSEPCKFHYECECEWAELVLMVGRGGQLVSSQDVVSRVQVQALPKGPMTP